MLHQLAAYLDNLAHLSPGFSPRYNMAVSSLIGERLPNSLVLMSFSLALGRGLALGAVMASFAGGRLDRGLSVVTLLFYSVPGFWIGLMLIVVFSVRLGRLPSGGAETIGADLSGWAATSPCWSASCPCPRC